MHQCSCLNAWIAFLNHCPHPPARNLTFLRKRYLHLLFIKEEQVLTQSKDGSSVAMDETIPGGYSTTTPAKSLWNMPRILLPEGSTIRVRKPEIWIDFLSNKNLPGEVIAKTIKPSDNVKSLKGFAIERAKQKLPQSVRVHHKQIVVSQGDTILKDNQKLVDFVFPDYKTLTISYPKQMKTFCPSQSSVNMEDDVFCMFKEL